MDGAVVRARRESGVTLIEVMVAMIILTVSMMAVGMTMAQGILASFISQEQLIAKQKAREALESVFTSRSTTDLEFSDLETLGDGGIFVSGWQPLREMGADGLALTSDDASEPIETVYLAGPDGVLGSADDEEHELNNFERRITFSPVLLGSGEEDEDIRMLTIDVRFLVNGRWWTVSVTSYISRFA
jgi:prepilin-type N-terminal cleavage/methylation domain-containing protein